MSDKGEVVKRLVGIHCPKCKAEIDFLKHYEGGVDYSIVTDDEDGSLRYEEQEFLPDGKYNEFKCPECDEALFTEEEGARKFLQGEM